MNLPKTLAHAYIVTGGGEESRHRYAGELAMAFVCPKGPPPCGSCRDCVKAAAGNHPDITTLAPAEGKKEITVDQARALRADVYIRPNEAARKVYVVDPADSLNPAAQNVLLKVVEEGPPYGAFILVAVQAGNLLETLRSRCETLTLPPEEDAVDPVQWERAEKLAKLLLKGDEWPLAAYMAELEGAKLKSGEVLDLYALTERALEPALRTRAAQAAPVLEKLRAFRGLQPFNVGSGHLLGALAVGGVYTKQQGG